MNKRKVLPLIETNNLCKGCGSPLLEIPWGKERLMWLCNKEGCQYWRVPQGGRERPKEQDALVRVDKPFLLQ